jgi:hypothetical protein
MHDKDVALYDRTIPFSEEPSLQTLAKGTAIPKPRKVTYVEKVVVF